MKSIPIIDINDIDVNRHDWAVKNRHLCTYPWTNVQVFFMEQGISPCCNLIKEYSADVFAPINELKQNIELGQLDSRCVNCYKCEDDGKVSERMRTLLGFDSERILKLIHRREIDEFYVQATLSSLCNMACRSCNGNLSSLYKKVWEGIDEPSATLSDNPRLWQAVLDSLTDAVQKHENVILVVSGGEGTVQPDFYKLVDWTIAQGISQQLTLQIGTNGTVVTKSMYENLTNNFRRVRLSLSVDSVGDNYYYVRWPVKWEKMRNHLDTFAEYKKTIENFDIMLSPVFSTNNIFYLSDWIRYFEEFSTRHDIHYLPTYDHTLYQPEWMDIQYLPDYVRPALVADIESVLENPFLLDDKNLVFRTNVIKLRDILLQNADPIPQAKYWTEYLKKTAQWDRLTNAYLEVHNKKLYDNLNDRDKKLFDLFKNQNNK